MHKLRHLRSLFMLASCCVGLAVAVLGLHALAHKRLALPSPSWQAWDQWTQTAGVATVVATLLEKCAEAAGAYLLLSILLSTLAELSGWHLLARFNELVSVPAARRLAKEALGISLVSTFALPAVANAATGAGVVSVTASPDTSMSDAPVLRHLGTARTPTTWTVDSFPSVTSAPNPPSTTLAPATAESTPALEAPTPGAAKVWSVKAGENLWTIARQSLVDTTGHNPDEQELTAYWKRLVETNRHVLAHPDNPDLIFPGQLLELP